MSEANDERQHLAPLPWSAGSYGISDDNRRVVLSLSIRLADKQNDANKRLLEMVVRAVNAHADLMSSLECARAICAAYLEGDTCEVLLSDIDAALAKARGEQ